jgi:type II secretory pathway pseudopilin PulG
MKDCTERGEMRQGEQGFMLVGLIVAIFLILLALSVAAPKVTQALRREREVEAVHRGNQYVRAIRLYYRKTGHYPGSIEQLEKTNNIRFLRQQYVDPLTGKADWKLIHVGEAKTTVKGFFGQPLAGLAPGLGAASGLGSSGAIGAGAAGPGQTGSGSAFGGSSSGVGGLGSSSPGTGGLGGSSGMPTLGGGTSTGGAASGPATLGSAGSTGSTGSTDSSGTGAGAGATNTLGSASGISSQSASSFSGGGAPFVGVGVPKEGDSITVLNEQTSYNTWEFIYDPRIEQLYAKGSLLGGGATGLGSAAGNASGFGSTPSSGFGSTPTTPGTGTSGFGTIPTNPTAPPPTNPTAPPQ